MTESVLEPALDRIARWSAILPETEPIPVTRDESYELAERLARHMRDEKGRMMDACMILKYLSDGALTVYGHKVVLL